MNEQNIIITRYNDSILFMSTDGDRPLEYQLFKKDEDTIGNIYVCEIKEQVPNIGACFVNYGDGKTGFLKSNKYRTGEMVALQLKKRGNKDKAPVFTDELSLSGIYTVLTNANKDFAISKKLPDERRKELRRLYGVFLSDLEYGITLRTNCIGAGLRDVLSEADSLAGIMDEILNTADKRTCGSILYKTDNEWIKYCFNANTASLKKIITDDEEIYESLKADVIGTLKSSNPNITLEKYSGKLLPLSKLYSIDKGIEEATSKKVWLKSGGFLYIEQTEALNTIDVNTGKTTGTKDKETTFFETNLEATEEICRQIRLRNLSGIIIIDYINMADEENLKHLIKRLRELIALDTVKTDFHDVTALSLVELTRQRVREPLAEQMKKAEEK